MDLIYTDAKRIDKGVLAAYEFDLSYGDSENDFELTLDQDVPPLEDSAVVYIEGTEYGGIVDYIKSASNDYTVTYGGRTWHGILNSKIIEPTPGRDYITVSGDANSLLAAFIPHLGLEGLFTAKSELSGITIKKYQFHRYCKAYDGLRAMLEDAGAKLKIEWVDRSVRLSAEPIADYTESPVDNDTATLSVESHKVKVNHLICLGKGELAAREVLHLYADRFGKLSNSQVYRGIEEYAEVYDNTSSTDLRKDGINRFKELRNIDKAEISLTEDDDRIYDIGDLVGATDLKTGATATTAVTQKIVKINNGAVSIEYKTGG